MTYENDDPFPTIPIPLLDLDDPRVTGTALATLPPIEAEILSDKESAALDRRIRSAVVRRIPTLPVPSERTKARVLAAARHAGYVRAGTGVAVARWRDAHGTARFERQMRAAEAAGDHDRLADWHDRSEKAKRDRHERAQKLHEVPERLVKAMFGGFGVLLMALTLLGVVLAAARSDFAAFVVPFSTALAVARVAFDVVDALWLPVLVGVPILALCWTWWQGRILDPRTPAPGSTWSPQVSGGTRRDVVPDESAILGALRNLNCAPLTKKFKEGWQPRWVQPTGRDGKGWSTQLELPPGVTVEMINDRKDVLAHNLVRLPVEVWPTEPKKQPGVLDLWVADQGLLTGPVDPYPLLTEGTADYFKGVQVGVDQRGTEVWGKLMACNYAIAGIMGSGKTSLVINLLCGAMLDPLVDIDVYVMAFNVDYDPMAPRLRTLVKGDEDDQITAAMDALRELRNEVTVRGKILAELGGDESKLTRAIAQNDPRMRPRVVVFDECQELFRHEKFGEEAKQLAIKVMMKARKVGITLIWITPAPSADSLPRDLAKTVSHRVCFAIGDHVGNDAILGSGAHRSGVTATNLVPGEDIGTAMASGFAARSGLLRTHHIKKEAGTDQIAPIVNRAMALREDAGITSEEHAVIEGEQFDPLADIAAVLGVDGRMRTQEVLSALAARNSDAYGQWTFTDLRKALPESAQPYKTDGGVIKVTADRVRESITERDRNEGGETDPDELDT